MMSRLAVMRDLPQRVLRRAWREISSQREKRHHLREPTLAAAESGAPSRLANRFARLDNGLANAMACELPLQVEQVRHEAELGIAHCFDLLGSGPTVVAHGCMCAGHDGHSYAMSAPVQADAEGRWLVGRINRSNLAAAQRIWQLVGDPYAPIDWQLDFRSGYRWREDCWYRDIRFENLPPGVDVKLPWELARMQHLPAIALACHFARAGVQGFRPVAHYATELRRQTLDFIATNPPAFGVNWACPMDVAIRAANLLIARDIALAAGHAFDAAFDAVFTTSMVAHGRHIVANLEWWPRYRGNHYLADIVGLMFLAVYLPRSAEVDAWLAFAAQELLAEVGYQFHEDGSNFEASVCYHRLSAEMVLWAFALLADLAPDKQAALQLSQRHPMLPRLRSEPVWQGPTASDGGGSPIPAWAWQRLARMADFTAAMTRPDGLVVQFGDSDSGRFATVGSAERLADPARPGAAWSLDHSSLVAGIRALTNRRPSPAAPADIATGLLLVLAGRLRSDPAPTVGEHPVDGRAMQVGDQAVWAELSRRRTNTEARSRWTTCFTAPVREPNLLAGLKCRAFPGMGCHVLRSARLYLAVRCGEIGVAGLGAHAHHDQLGIELVIDGITRVRDPGTYCYTPFPARRAAYRSAAAHHVPKVVGRGLPGADCGLFDMRGSPAGQCLYFGPLGFVGRHGGYGPWVYRQIVLSAWAVEVHDFVEGGLVLADPSPASLPFSPGYGHLDTEGSRIGP